MIEVFAVVFPVFAVIGAGYAAVRFGGFPDSGVDAILSFTTRFAVPTLLFVSMYELALDRSFDWRALISFYTGAFACFAIAIFGARAAGRRPGEAIAIGFGAYFSNTVLVGLPIMNRAYGPEEVEAMFGVIAVHAPLLYSCGMVAMEVSRQGGEGAMVALQRAARSIARNGLTLGILIGLALNLLKVDLPGPLMDAARLLGAGALPTALFGLGAALTRYRVQAELGLAAMVAALSLVLHPLIAYLLAHHLFGLDDYLVRAAVVTAAMPAGLNAYVFAAMYHRAEGVAASAVILSTAAAIVSVSVWLSILGGAGGI